MSIPKLLAALFGLLVVLWLGSGVFVVNPGHSGVVFRFGAVARSVEPGVQVRLVLVPLHVCRHHHWSLVGNRRGSRS